MLTTWVVCGYTSNMTNNTTAANIEFTYKTEYDAHVARRVAINAGRAVSLIAFDPSREMYVFDVRK